MDYDKQKKAYEQQLEKMGDKEVPADLKPEDPLTPE